MPGVVKALHDGGFDGSLSLEVDLIGEQWSMLPEEEIVTRSLAYLRSLLLGTERLKGRDHGTSIRASTAVLRAKLWAAATSGTPLLVVTVRLPSPESVSTASTDSKDG